MPRPYDLPKYPLTVLRDDTVSSVLQRPAASALIDVYKEGAMVQSGTTIGAGGGTGTLTVYDVGAIEVGDQLFTGTATTVVVDVTGIPTATTINVTNNTGTAFVVTQFARVTPFTDRPTIYQDERGVDPTVVASQVTTNAQGFAEFYGYDFDAIVSGGGLAAPQLLTEQASIGGETVVDPRKWGFVGDGVADDTVALQAAINYAERVGRAVVVVPGTPLITSQLTLAIANTKIRGFGIRSTRITTSSATQPIFLITAVSDIQIEDMELQRTDGFAIPVVDVSTSAGASLRCQRLLINDGGNGFNLNGGLADTILEDISWLGANNTRMITVTGGTSRVVLRDIRGLHTAAAMTVGIQLESCNVVTLDNVEVSPGNPATQGGLALRFVTGGGGDPTDVVVLGSRFAGGIAANGVQIDNGTGIKFVSSRALDSLKGYVYNGGEGISFTDCVGLGCQDESWRINSAVGVVTLTACESSDANQVAGAFDHVGIATGKGNVTIDGLVVGNHIRGGATEARDGVRLEGSHISTIIHKVRRSPTAPEGITGDVVHVVTTSILVGSTIDISHNSHRINNGFAFDNEAHEHVTGGYPTRTVTSGSVLNAGGAAGVVFNSGGVLTMSSYTEGLETQKLSLFNLGAGTITLNHVANVWENTGGGAETMVTGTKVEYTYISGAWRQMTAVQAA